MSDNREQIFSQAAEMQDPAKRSAFLDQACEGDDKLRDEIEDLLKHDESAGSFLENPPFAVAPTIDPGQTTGVDEAILPRPGRAIAGRNASDSGTTVRYFGDYELVEEVARGGMGVVYKARQTSLNRTVALKMILSGQLASESDVRRFQTEAEAAANLRHPNIVAIHEVGQHEGQHFFSMDFIEGKSLADVVHQNPMPARDAARYVQTIAEAIQYAHQHGTLHRDLKPHNVLIDHNDQPQVTDFGLAKQIDANSKLTATGAVIGTPSYMPPEQVSTELGEMGPTSDVYSLGAVLYELVTGRPPFHADSPLDTMRQVLDSDAVSPRVLNPSVPRDVATICLKCLEKNPRRRYSSAQELADELGRFIGGKPIDARPVGPLERTWRWSKRHPTTAVLSTALVLTLLMATVTGSLMAFHESALRNVAEQRGRTSRAHLYLAEIQLAHQAWKDSAIARVEEILQSHRPEYGDEDLRGWEWYYLLSLCHRSLFELHNAGAIAVSPDGGQLAVGSWSPPMISIYDLETGKQLASMSGHAGKIYALAWSPDGSQLASAGRDKAVRVWDRATKELICTLTGHEDSVHALAWQPSGTQVASGSRDGTLRVWDVDKQNEVARLEHRGYVGSITWRPDGQQLVWTSVGDGLKTWETQTWTEANQDTPPPDLIDSLTYCAAWAADGKRLAVAGLGRGMKPRAIVWDRDSNQRLTLQGHRREVVSVAWSPNGTRLATGSWDKTVRIWDAATGQQLLILRGHMTRADQIVWSANGQRIATRGSDCVEVWDVTMSQEATTLAMTDAQSHSGRNEISWNANSDAVAAVDTNNNMSIWDTRGRRQWSAEGTSGPVAWSPDGQHIAVAADRQEDDEIQPINIWSTSTREIVATLAGHRGSIRNLCWSPDGSRLASTSIGFRQRRNGQDVFQVESDRVIRIWDVQSGNELRSIDAGPSDYVDCIAWSPSGREICWGRGERVGFVDANTSRSLLEFSAGAGLRALAWSPTGDQIVVGFWSIDAIGIFDVATGEKQIEFQGHSANAVSWNKDRRRIASSGEDGTIRIWDATTGREVFTLTQSTFTRAAASAVRWSPDGQRLAAWQDGTVKIYDASIGYAREGSGPMK